MGCMGYLLIMHFRKNQLETDAPIHLTTMYGGAPSAKTCHPNGYDCPGSG